MYAASILALTGLVGAAFFSPGWFFGIQDKKHCSDTVLEERENVDVAVLSTNYETSFYQRMINFAEKQMENVNYYVASENLTDYELLRDFLDSDKGLYRDSMWTLLEMNLLDERLFDLDYRVNAWKQYVIYSDDYASGVNFILWYIELEYLAETKEYETCKLLLEAETGEIYGIYAGTGRTLVDYESYYRKYLDKKEILSLLQCFDSYDSTMIEDGWSILAYLYSGLVESDFWQYYELYNLAVNRIYDEVSMAELQVYMNEEEQVKAKMGIDNEMEEEWMEFLSTYPTMQVWDDGNRLECTFPYGKGRMVFRMQMAESIEYPWTLRDITIGFPAIYELIPEFG